MMPKGFTEAQCDLLHQAALWREERSGVMKEHAALTEENNRLREALESVRYLSDSSSHTPSKGLMILTSDIATRALEGK